MCKYLDVPFSQAGQKEPKRVNEVLKETHAVSITQLALIRKILRRCQQYVDDTCA